MTPNYQAIGLKTKEEAFQRIFTMILENPACAGNEGTVVFNLWGKMFTLRPKKKKEKE